MVQYVALQAMFERHVRARPSAVAVVAPVQLSFAELDAMAQRVASGLRKRGVGVCDRVAILGETSLEVLVSMLAVLKVGACYVPLRASDPDTRRCAVADAARPNLVIAAHNDVTTRLDVVPFDRLEATRNDERESATVDLGADAYVLFTSGSTGQPKGVAISHAALSNYVDWVAEANRVDGAVPLLPTVTSFAFDASVQQLLAPLARGAGVWITPREVAQDPERLLAELRAHDGVGLHCVPSLWAECLELIEHRNATAPSLAALFLGGEVVRQDLWSRTRELLPNSQMANVYGPTETTVQITGGFQAKGEPLSCGRPVSNVTVEVIDASGNPLGDGQEGQVRIAGIAVGRYIDPPAAGPADAGFVEHPGRGRCFLTGDRGVLLENGALRVLGRSDDLIKRRGYRIDPREIEAAAASLSSVTECGVGFGGGEADARLCLAIVPRSREFDRERLLRHLRERLPEYMLPDDVVQVDRLARLPNGKLDRSALRNIASPRVRGAPGASTSEHGCRDEFAQRIAAVWSGAFGFEVSDDDNFFALGGHSLLATRVVARTRAATSRKFPLRTIFDFPTLRDFIAQVRVAASVDAGAPSVPRPAVVEAPLSLQQRILWSAENDAQGNRASMVFAAIALPRDISPARVEQVVAQLVLRHPVLRCTFPSVAGTPVARLIDWRPVVVGIDTKDDPRSLDVVIFECIEQSRAVRYDLVATPPLRITHIRHQSRDVLLLHCHHIISDGESLRIIGREFLLLLDKGVSVPAEAPGYLDYAVEQARKLARGEMTEIVDYWRRELGTQPYRPLEERPCDAPACKPHILQQLTKPELSRAVRNRSRAAGITEYAVFAGALGHALLERNGAAETRIGALVANRLDHHSENLVGPLANTVVLRLKPASRSIVSAIDVAAQALVGALQHQGLPLEIVLALTLEPTSEALIRPFDATLQLEVADVDAAGADGLLRASAHLASREDMADGLSSGLDIVVEQVGLQWNVVALADPLVYPVDDLRKLLDQIIASLHHWTEATH